MTEESIAARASEEDANTAAAPAVVAPARHSLPQQDTSSEGDETEWRAGMPDDIRRVAAKFASAAEAVKSYAALERRLGRSVTIPGKGASAAEIAAFFTRLGRPETPDGYAIRIPENLPDRLRSSVEAEDGREAFLTAMHDAGATPGVVQAAVDWYCAALTRADSETRRVRDAVRAEADKSLRTEWGSAYDRKLELARRAARHYGGDDLIARFEQVGLADDPVCLRAFSAIGAAMAEDGLLSGSTAPAGSAEQKIDRIMKEHFGQPSYGSAAVQNELRQLYRTVYGDDPADSASG